MLGALGRLWIQLSMEVAERRAKEGAKDGPEGERSERQREEEYMLSNGCLTFDLGSTVGSVRVKELYSSQ